MRPLAELPKAALLEFGKADPQLLPRITLGKMWYSRSGMGPNGAVLLIAGTWGTLDRRHIIMQLDGRSLTSGCGATRALDASRPASLPTSSLLQQRNSEVLSILILRSSFKFNGNCCECYSPNRALAVDYLQRRDM